MIDFSRAKIASLFLKKATTEQKNAAISRLSSLLVENADSIIAANDKDIEAAKNAGVSDVMLDRLRLTKTRLDSIASDA